ncbi:MAG: glycosyl hydrolase-related protein [Actinobacteria bacterium]|nr:glycosyl hydrolase-related protein [Actinomycetota bacterium]
MHDDRVLLEARLDRFIAERLRPAVHSPGPSVTVERWDVPGEPVSFYKAMAQDFHPAHTGDAWGTPWSTMWLKLTGEVPDGFGDGPDVDAELVVDLGFTGTGPGFQAEGLAWRPDATLVKAISPRNSYVRLAQLGSALVGNRFTIYVEAAGNPAFPQPADFSPNPDGRRETAGHEPLYTLGEIRLVERHTEVAELLADTLALAGLMRELPPDLPRRSRLLRALDAMVEAVDPDDVVGTTAAGRAILAPALAAPASASAHTLVATGHAHIDSAWLWPVRETVRKCARTFSSVAALAEDHPDFVFACSQAQQLAWIKEGYPDLFERLQRLAERGQFVPVGGMWVEADTNMTGSEAMARQFLEGKSFMAAEFGVDCEEVWLPDTFGYSAGLPQVAVAAGMKWFLTQKISWNQVNRMPHHTFWWEGIDGSRIFTHFPPVDTYNCEVSPAELAHAERNFADHGRASVSLLPFGYGDGGGGPTREMLASAARASDLEGSPRVVLGSPRDFFTRAQAENPDAPVWLGEMYLELHRGTLTTQANTKRGNRRCEHLLREAELWASTAAVRCGLPYPADELTRCWRTVLLQQFHDILPGSSIGWVYTDAERNYVQVAEELEGIIADSLKALAGDGEVALFANAAPHPWDGVPALGLGTVDAGEPATVTPGPTRDPAGSFTLSNPHLTAVIDARGLLVSLVDARTGREAIAPDVAGNVLTLHRDVPNQWDAWDIDEFYRRSVVPDGGEVEVSLEDSGDEPAVVVQRVVGGSPVTQRITLAANAPALAIHTRVDWREHQKLLKLGFGFDLRADTSAAETHFGHYRRPTHTNTSWDQARFEFCAHRWLLVDEPGYGVSVANDSTYGHEVTRDVRSDGGTTTTVRLSLLRAPVYPDPQADLGEHEFVVTVRPDSDAAKAVEQGYHTNLGLRRVLGSGPVEPLFTVSDPGLVIEAVKLAEDGSGDVVVRLYEAHGQRTSGRLEPGFAALPAVTTDLLERPVDAPAGVRADDGGVELTLRPFQLVTLRFARAGEPE